MRIPEYVWKKFLPSGIERVALIMARKKKQALGSDGIVGFVKLELGLLCWFTVNWNRAGWA